MRAAALAALAMIVGCGSSEVMPVVASGPPTLRLAATQATFELVLDAGSEKGRALVTVDVAEAPRGELMAVLRLAKVEGVGGPLDGLEGVSFRWRMTPRGQIVAAGGPAGPSRVPREALERALELWPLVAAVVPNLPEGPVVEGAVWDAAQRTDVIGGGREHVVILGGQWKLAKILAGSPPTVVLEGELRVTVRDPTLPPERIELEARSFPARAVVYVNLERHAVDFATVSSEAISWQARRL
jgi:hypothetical protein